MHVHFVGEIDDGISVSSHHARALVAAGASVSFEEEISPPQVDRPRPDIIHLVTFEQLSNALLRQLVAARMAGVQIARYWTGRDVVWAANHGPSQEFALALGQMGAVQFCRSPELARQLAALGISAKSLPVISGNISIMAPPQGLPKTFTILCHLPRDRREFHGGSVIDALVARLPYMRFLILGGGGATLANRANVEWLCESTDSIRAIHRSTVIVDPRVDCGLSRLSLEALSHGRHVITGYNLPHARAARSIEEFVQALRRLRKKADYNLDGRSFANREHEYYAAAKALRRELEDAIEPGRLNLVLEGSLRGAATTLQNMHVLSPRTFPLPDTDRLPVAHALRSLLQDMAHQDQPAGATA